MPTQTTTHISQRDADRCRCAGYHSGPHRLTVTSDHRHVECQGCGDSYSAQQCWDAIEGFTTRELGQGGVTIS